MVKNDSKTWVIVVVVAIVVAVIASLITVNITGNVVSVAKGRYAKVYLANETYSMEEVDTLLSKKTTSYEVLKLLNGCKAYEMGSGEPSKYLNKDSATGDDICNQRRLGSTCISAGRIYSTSTWQQTGYGIWSCGSVVVESSPPMNGWALCCQ